MLSDAHRKQQVIPFLFVLSFLAAFLFLIWKCRYGYANIDEAFYLTIPYRLCRGDSLIIHEWHLSQLAGFLMYPLMKLYLAVVKTTEGILLNFRYLFTAFWALNALFLYYRLKPLSQYGAMLASIAFLLYTPFGIMALSYNSMGIMLLLDACVILTTAEKQTAVQHTAAGLLFAGAVLCCPYLLLVFVLFSVTAILLGRKHKKLLAAWLWMSLGCLILLLVFAAYLLGRTTVAGILQMLPQLFNDPEHPPIPIGEKTLRFAKAVLFCNRLFPWGFLLTLFIVLFCRKDAAVGLIALCVVIAAIQLDFLIEKPYLNYMMFPINLIAPYCAVCSERREIRIPFFAIWLPGALYAYCICLSSNQWFYAASSASTVMTAASVLILARFTSELLRKKSSGLRTYAAVAAVMCLFGLQLFSELSLRYSSVFWEEEGMQAQTVYADSGPEKGILMTPERLEAYLSWEEDMVNIRADGEITKLLTLSRNTHLYLSADKEIAAFSAWLSRVNDVSVSRLDTYFELCPEKKPDGIYIEEEYSQYVGHFVEQGYRSEQLASGAYLLKSA